jgi:thiamine-monophosphate kinase
MESEFIAALKEIFATTDPKVTIGIGDDGAVVAPTPLSNVLAADMAVEGVHFNRNWSSLKQIGAKVTAANLADIFAMGGTPKYLLVSAGLPKEFSIAELTDLATGIKDEAKKVGAYVVGGDISLARELVISISVFGEVENPITRSGAKAGDAVILSNLTGNSAAGLVELQLGINKGPFIAAHQQPIVKYEMAIEFAKAKTRVNAMSDVSDGLYAELSNIATDSKVGIELDTKLISALAGFGTLSFVSEQYGMDIWDWILNGGEDHAFVATTSNQIPSGAMKVGQVIAGSGVSVLNLTNFKPGGYRHFDK